MLVKPTTNANQQFIAKDNDTGGRAYTLDTSGGVLRFYINGGAGANIVNGSTNILNAYHFLVGTYDRNGTLQVWVDGILDGTSTGADTFIPSASTNLRLCARACSGFEGFLDGTFIIALLYERTLPFQEIYALSLGASPLTLKRRVVVKAAGAKIISVGQVIETDTAQAVLWAPKSRLVAQATETDLAQAIGRLKAKQVGQTTESDLAQALNRLKTQLVGQTFETDLAQAVTTGGGLFATVNQVTETDLAQALSRLKTLLVGQTTESDLAQAVSGLKTKSVAQVTETDLAQALSHLKARLVGQVTESDLAQIVSHLKARGVTQVTETDLAQAVGKSKVKSVGQTTEMDLAQTVSWAPKARLVNQVLESDTAQAISLAGLLVPDIIRLLATSAKSAYIDSQSCGVPSIDDIEVQQPLLDNLSLEN